MGKPDMHLMLVDGEVRAVDMGPVIERHRRAHLKHRADAIDQAADLLMDEAFDVRQTCEAAEAAGMPEAMMDAAGNVARELLQVEQLRG